MRRLRFLLALCISALSAVALSAAEEQPAAEGQPPAPERVSLLTCSPGQDAYTRFGHTALRVQTAGGEDLVFNYGIFSFRTDHFIYRFVKGETDYELGLQTFDHFVDRYTSEGFSVSEQDLNLSAEERMAVARFLAVNYLPENRIYRYNFLYDNCTTRALDALEQALPQPLDFSASTDTAALTHRDIIRRCVAAAPWLSFGIDMVLGAEADHPLTGSNWRKRLFIPAILQENLRVTGLVASERDYVPTQPMAAEKATPVTPLRVACVLLIAAIVLSCTERRHRGPACVALGFDIALHTLQGLAGCIVAFLFFLSEHPAVGTNWLVICLNPLAFVLVAQDIHLFRRRRGLWRMGRVDVLETVNLAALLLTSLLACTPLQVIHPAMRLLALILIIRSLSHLYSTHHP